ncbi:MULTISPECIES: hypothetical protein [unclassified Bartonella]|uniref:hypothetical protein n=1 Tax=unclassified Bartonella TaxID=2645622 RepID=UPI00235FDA97|nr:MULTISPECIES: hypothetical protein [unclassified Bartonella]
MDKTSKVQIISYEGLCYKSGAIFWVANKIVVLAWIFTGGFSKNAGIILAKG